MWGFITLLPLCRYLIVSKMQNFLKRMTRMVWISQQHYKQKGNGLMASNYKYLNYKSSAREVPQ